MMDKKVDIIKNAYDNAGELVRYNVFRARILVRHAKDGKLYLYDVLRTKKRNEQAA